MRHPATPRRHGGSTTLRTLLATLATASALLSGCGGAATAVRTEPDRTQPPAPGTPRPFALPESRTLRLDNGLEVVLLDRAGVPNLSMRLSVRAGRDQKPDNVSVATLTTRLLRDGAAGRSSAEVASFIDGNGLAFSGAVDANRAVLAVDGLTQSAPAMLRLLTDLVSSPGFPEDRVAARKAEYLGEIERDRAQPDYHLQRLTYRVLFGDHPYAALQPEPAQVEAVTRADIEGFFAATFAPSRARLVVVGDLPDGFEATLRETLGSWRHDAPAWQPLQAPAIRVCNEAFVVLRPDSVQTNINWVGPGVTQGDPAFFATLVANQVLGGNAGARLFMNLREARSYTYGAYSRLQQILGASWFTAFSNVRSEVTEGALTEFRNEFSRVANEPFAPAELAGAVDYLAGIFPIQNEQNAPLADSVLRTLDLGLPLTYLTGYRDAVRGVSGDAALAAGRATVRGEALSLILVGGEEKTVAPAGEVTSKVTVYDLGGNRLREVPGKLPRTCTE